MSNYQRICICCGSSYYDRDSKDSLCDECNGNYWSQERYGFYFQESQAPSLYDWQPTKKYFETIKEKR